MGPIYPRLAKLLTALSATPMTMREIDQQFGTGNIRDTQAWVLALRRSGLIYVDHWLTHGQPGGSKQGTPVYGAEFKCWPDCPKPEPKYAVAARKARGS